MIRHLLYFAAGLLSAYSALASDTYPSKPVRWLAPVLSGGAGDLIIARTIAPKLSEAWVD